MNDKISVIIPSVNEEKGIWKAVRSAASGEGVEIIVADGGSEDATLEIAEAEGAKTLRTNRGRAIQMNRGAEAASGQILVFLHADTTLPRSFDSEVRRLLKSGNVAAGAFTLKTDYDSRWMKTMELMVALRSKWLSLPYGDQAIFTSKDLFEKTGGFPNIPIMEDFAYMRVLRKHGRIAISDLAVLTSGRRWRQQGVLRNTFVNQALVAGYFLGISPSKLRELRRKLHQRASS